ncbi:MAG TPA: helix-turn-helix transcriptional regulator [Deltaproteobacteria bacterium]|nr:helix-turn-helix transcriptional regulator [Deltaproteobacteria bacterium]
MERTLKTLRQSRKLSLKELAARAGCAPGTLAVYETNPPAAASPEIIDGLARALSVTPEYILKLMGSAAAAPAASKAQRRPRHGKKSAAKAPKLRTEPAEKKAIRAAGIRFTLLQTTLMTSLIRNEIKRLRELIVQAGCGDKEDAKLKAVIQGASADLKDLQALNRLIVKGKTD